MATAGLFSPENEYFCRYFRLVNETAVKPLRKILENAATARKLTVENFLLNHQKTLKVLFQRGIIQKHQYDKIFPQTGPFVIENIDLSLMCAIIKNICILSNKGRNACEDIRNSRNELCHTSDIALSRLDYYSKFSYVHNKIKILLQEYQDVTFETAIESEIKNIDESPVSVSPVLNLFKEFLFAFAQDSRIAETVADRIRQLEVSVTDIYSSTDKKLRDIYARVEKQPILTAEAIQNIFQKGRSFNFANTHVGHSFLSFILICLKNIQYETTTVFFNSSLNTLALVYIK
jgi:hypothetical protein